MEEEGEEVEKVEKVEEEGWKPSLVDFVGSTHPQEMHGSQEIFGFGWSSSRDLNGADMRERTLWNFVSFILHFLGATCLLHFLQSVLRSTFEF